MTTSSLDFRLATVEDAAVLERLINTAFRDDKTTQVFLSVDHTGIDVTSASAIVAKINQPDCAVLAVTDLSTGSIVAHGSVRKLDDGRAWFGMLAVDVGRQKQGLGGQVLAWAERFARAQWGSPRMEFDVVNTRVDLIAWYNRRGYQPTGETTPFPYEYHGNWQGVLRDNLRFINLGKDL
ncbi:putative acyl- N-acyltransferase [Rosellinia necatrix]|uniref:Putative acyl-N-acyltransferase n=1 Tax=Rosellinia necatrix TaxID=77044 RepID=A0A1W2TSR6_ROSNE|nr:putative acyl- N-acyltransferase [Rosellinia necatrix]